MRRKKCVKIACQSSLTKARSNLHRIICEFIFHVQDIMLARHEYSNNPHFLIIRLKDMNVEACRNFPLNISWLSVISLRLSIINQWSTRIFSFVLTVPKYDIVILKPDLRISLKEIFLVVYIMFLSVIWLSKFKIFINIFL